MLKTNHHRLSKAEAGTEFLIETIQSTPETSQRLRELGFREKVIVKTIVNRSSQLICQINNTRIGIHHRVADNIFISPLEADVI